MHGAQQDVGPRSANVNIVTANVKSSTTVFTASSPRTTVWPVAKPTVSAAGTVRLMLASTEPNSKFTERWSWLAHAARAAATDSGNSTSTDTRNPPRLGGAWSTWMP